VGKAEGVVEGVLEGRVVAVGLVEGAGVAHIPEDEQT
jgi:hypothetical protein